MPSEKLNLAQIFWAFAGISLVMLVGIAFPRNDLVLVVGWPGTDQPHMMQIISGAGGSFVAGGAASWLAVARAEDRGLPARLMRQGAMLVLDHSLAVGCIEKD